jgi:hypothetical protein
LQGPPNSPENCHYKEINTTIIIECKPGFHQGDRDTYYYLLYKNTSGVLIEYSRKRDSCSFLLSNSVLREYKNEFYIYSSNKYGDNKENAEILIIYNERLQKDAAESANQFTLVSKRITIVVGSLAGALVVLCICCCVSRKCKSNAILRQKSFDKYPQKHIDVEYFESKWQQYF